MRYNITKNLKRGKTAFIQYQYKTLRPYFFPMAALLSDFSKSRGYNRPRFYKIACGHCHVRTGTDDKLPSYYIFADFVFLPLTQAYMDLADVSESLSGKIPRKAGEQIVILSQDKLEALLGIRRIFRHLSRYLFVLEQVLEDDVNAGYRDLEDLQEKLAKRNKKLASLFLWYKTIFTFNVWTGDTWTEINVKNFKRFIRASSTIVELKDTTLTTMFVCGQGREDFDYVVEIDANITMNKEQERSLKFVDKELKLDVVDRVVTQTLNIDIKNVTY
ncbi:hypothetical protein YC2023_015863 [Brassica napus]